MLNGHLYKGSNQCTGVWIAVLLLAEAEVEYEDKVSPSIYVRFPAVSAVEIEEKFNAVGKGHGKLSAVIWTTTPWTIPSNRGIALNAELEYNLVQFGDERVILAAELVESVAKAVGVEQVEILGSAKGKALELVRFHHPFYNFTVPVILGDHVTTDGGTGLVHTAPDHGLDDFIVGQKI